MALAITGFSAQEVAVQGHTGLASQTTYSLVLTLRGTAGGAGVFDFPASTTTTGITVQTNFGNNWTVIWGRTTTNTSYTFNSVTASNANRKVLITLDQSGSAGSLIRLWKEAPSGTLTEVTPASSTDGSGTFRTPSIYISIGNLNAGTVTPGSGVRGSGNTIDLAALFTSVITPQQAENYINTGVGLASLKGAWRLGENGATGNLRDHSGTGNTGNIISTPALAANYPHPRWRRKTWAAPYAVAAAPTGQPTMRRWGAVPHMRTTGHRHGGGWG